MMSSKDADELNGPAAECTGGGTMHPESDGVFGLLSVTAYYDCVCQLYGSSVRMD